MRTSTLLLQFLALACVCAIVSAAGAPAGGACGSNDRGKCIPRNQCGAPKTIQFGLCEGDSYCCIPPLPAAGQACGPAKAGLCTSRPDWCVAPKAIQKGHCAGTSYCCMPAGKPATPGAKPATPGAKPATPGAKPAAPGAKKPSTKSEPIPSSPYASMNVMYDLERAYGPGEPSRKRPFYWTDFTKEQQTNIQMLVKFAKTLGLKDINMMAYILGTSAWESHLKPIKEIDGAWAYYAPYFGRGFVQITHRTNYDKFNGILRGLGVKGVDLVANPEQALNPVNAAWIATYGMIKGTFTGHKLSHHFSDKEAHFTAARAIINGNDRAALIANIAMAFIPLCKNMMASPDNSPN